MPRGVIYLVRWTYSRCVFFPLIVISAFKEGGSGGRSVGLSEIYISVFFKCHTRVPKAVMKGLDIAA